MAKHSMRAAGLGIIGLGAGCLMVWVAVSSWTSLSSRWINLGAILPILGLIGGLALAEPTLGDRRDRLRAALAAMALPLGMLGNYLAWLITSRTWFADRIAPEQQSFLFQFLNPSVLPGFVERGQSGGLESEETYLKYLIVGAFVGPVVLWLATRRPLRAAPTQSPS